MFGLVFELRYDLTVVTDDVAAITKRFVLFMPCFEAVSAIWTALTVSQDITTMTWSFGHSFLVPVGTITAETA